MPAEVRQSVDDRLQLRDGRLGRRVIAQDEEGQRVDDLLERDCRLHQSAELHLPRKDARYGDHIGKEESHAPVQLRHPRELHAAQHEMEKISAHRLEPPKRSCALAFLSVIKSDALNVLAQARKSEAQVRLVLLLAIAQANDGPSRPERRPCAEERIADRKPYHVAGQRNGRAAERNVDHAREPPQYRAERRDAQRRVEDTEREIEKI